MGTGDEPSGSDDAVTAAGGFCMPSVDAVYDASLMNRNEFTHIGFPRVRASRYVDWFQTPTPAERRAADALRSLTSRIAERMSAQRNAAIDAACLTAMAEGWDVHVYEPPEPLILHRATDNDLIPLAYVGIEFTERAHPVPTVHFHQSYVWEDD